MGFNISYSSIQIEARHSKTLQRKLFRLAGLFELADEQFIEIKEDHRVLLKKIKKENIETSKRDLNLLTVEEFMMRSKIVKKIYQIAMRAGFTDENDEDAFGVDKETDTFSDLITLCNYIGINSVKGLDDFLKAQKPTLLKKYLLDQFSDDRKAGNQWIVSPPFILILILIYAFKDKIDAKYLIKVGWSKDIAERVIDVCNK